jgi:tetratricopeptide (TPR) repeat protein
VSTRERIAGANRPRWSLLAVVVALAAAAWAAHGGALGGKFHYDDLFTVVNNPAVRSWHLARAFVSADAVNIERHAAGYRPFTVTTLAVNYRLHGLDPRGYLVTNMALHALAAAMVALVGLELLGALPWALLAGLVFALHPINAEAVNYITARSSLLSTVFVLGAAWAFIRYVESRGRAATLGVGLAAYALALLSKESAVALIVPLLAYPWLRPSFRRDATTSLRAARATSAFAVLAALYVAAYWLIAAGGVVAPGPAQRPAWTLAELVGRSLALWVWPWPLGLDHRLTFLARFDSTLAVVLVLGVAALLAAFAVVVRRVPVAAWGLVWALAGLAPLAPLPWLTTVGLLQEHRMGFSAAGLSWMTMALVRALWEASGNWRCERIIRWSLVSVGAVLAVAAVGVDRWRSSVWQDERRLWAEVVQRSPDNLVARINLGAAYMERGDYDLAEAQYHGIIARVPGYARAYYNLGLLALRRGRTDEAAATFRQTVALAPRDAAAYSHLGILALRAGDLSGAEAAFQAALRIDPTQREALNNLATMFLERRDWPSALSLVDEALRRDPDFIEAAYNRGVALAGLGRRAEANAVLGSVRSRLPADAAFDRYRRGIDHLLAGGSP